MSDAELCKRNGVSRSGFHRWVDAASSREAREQQDREYFDLILTACKQRGFSKDARSILMVYLHLDPPAVMNMAKIPRLMDKFNPKCPIRKTIHTGE